MPTRQEAEEHLRVIRSLMERSTIYRAISAPVALIAGLCTLLGSGLIAVKCPPTTDDPASNTFFLATWLVVLAITALSNVYFLWHEAGKRGEAFLSPGLRAALRALLPSWLVSMVFTVLLAEWSFLLPVVWMILYGLSLLATQHFAPRSIILLGWAFLLAGLCSTTVLWYWGNFVFPDTRPCHLPNIAMGATFGLFHLVYAACTWPRNSATANSGAEP